MLKCNLFVIHNREKFFPCAGVLGAIEKVFPLERNDKFRQMDCGDF